MKSEILLECLNVLIPEWLPRSNYSINQAIRQSSNLLYFQFLKSVYFGNNAYFCILKFLESNSSFNNNN